MADDRTVICGKMRMRSVGSPVSDEGPYPDPPRLVCGREPNHPGGHGDEIEMSREDFSDLLHGRHAKYVLGDRL